MAKGMAASTARRRLFQPSPPESQGGVHGKAELFQPSPPERQGGVHGKAEALPTFTTGKAGRGQRQGGGSSNLHHRKGRAVSTARWRLFQPSPPERQGGVLGKAEALPTFTTGFPQREWRWPRKGPDILRSHFNRANAVHRQHVIPSASLSPLAPLDSPTILVIILPRFTHGSFVTTSTSSKRSRWIVFPPGCSAPVAGWRRPVRCPD